MITGIALFNDPQGNSYLLKFKGTKYALFM